MTQFVASTPLNLVWRHRSGANVEIVADRRSGVPWPAGVPFDIPTELADDFAREFGPRPNDASISAAGRDGRIPGLTRL